jgi:glycerol-3-phosphate dehydrogenase
MAPEFEVAVIGAGVVGCATALSLSRRGAAVALLEAEPEPGLGASGTNSGILHTGFDSTPGELETELILATARIRDELLDSLGVPVMRCGALMLPADESERAATAELAVNARHNGVAVNLGSDGSLEIPGEAVTDPVSYTLALAGAATGQGADLRTGWNAVAVESSPGGLTAAAERTGRDRRTWHEQPSRRSRGALPTSSSLCGRRSRCRRCESTAA